VVVVVVVDAVDVVVAVAFGCVDAAKWCEGVDVADVSSTRKAAPPARTATITTTSAMTLPDGRRRVRVIA
jgi:hypothetical protein